jgi:hypothetical protein
MYWGSKVMKCVDVYFQSGGGWLVMFVYFVDCGIKV